MATELAMSSERSTAAVQRPADRSPMIPVPHRVLARRQETGDVTTLTLEPVHGAPALARHGQFNMLSVFGVGEAAISVSSLASAGASLQHTVRDVGPVSHALCSAAVGDVIGVRGPFGTDWRVGGAEAPGAGTDGDVVVVAGGIGLAPLRGAVDALARQAAVPGRRVVLIVGAREPGQIIFADDLDRWAGDGVQVVVTVDVATPDWKGNVGVVTARLREVEFDPAGATALVCGPEVMIRWTARMLEDRGVDTDRILVSLERNMQCGLGWCGHCQLGPFLLCRDGPVVSYGGVVSHLLGERER